MTEYYRYDKVKTNGGKTIILYRKLKSPTLYVKHNGKMVYYSTYKSKYLHKKGGQAKTSILKYYIMDEDGNDVKIEDDFRSRVERKLQLVAVSNTSSVSKYEVYDLNNKVLSSKYEISYHDNILDILFEIPDQDMYDTTNTKLHKMIKQFKQLYINMYDPIRIFACKKDKIMNGLVLCNRDFATHMNLIEQPRTIKLSISHIRYKNATVQHIQDVLNVNGNSIWQQIYDDGLHHVKIDAVRDAYLGNNRHATTTTVKSSKSAKHHQASPDKSSEISKYNMSSLDPYMMHTIFTMAQSADDEMNNNQLANFIYHQYVT
jgi:hypothetical protein